MTSLHYIISLQACIVSAFLHCMNTLCFYAMLSFTQATCLSCTGTRTRSPRKNYVHRKRANDTFANNHKRATLESFINAHNTYVCKHSSCVVYPILRSCTRALVKPCVCVYGTIVAHTCKDVFFGMDARANSLLCFLMHTKLFPHAHKGLRNFRLLKILARSGDSTIKISH
jgi:hypothetical protein